MTAILSANTDPHAYEVRPDDVKALAGADVVLRSGGETDEWLDGALDSAGVSDDKIVDAGAAAGLEGDDPHWWQDPAKAVKAAEAIGRGIPGADAAPYVEKLRALDSGVQACIDTVPEGERLLVTSHDALGYYARRYGIRVVGTVIPSLSTSGQPSAGEVDALVQTIRDTGVKTIFAESSVNAKVEAAIAAESGDEGRQGAVGGLARARGLGRRDLHRLDRVQHERAGRRLHRQARELLRRWLTSPPPTSSAA